MPLVQTRGAASAQGFGEFTQTGTVVKVNGSPVSTNTYIYNNNNTVNTIQVVGGNKSITFSLWGAAGGNGGYATQSFGSGAGGFTKGTITLQNNITYYLYVGQGGRKPNQVAYGTAGSGGWPNGGYGTIGDANGAGGGGMTMLSAATFNTSMSNTDIYLISGGGGGSTGYNNGAGAGGGTNGQDASGAITGGTQSAGGTNNGTKLQGGNATGGQSTGNDDGGGGGGGFYGGGGGTSDAYPGAGGSGYFNTSVVTLGSTTQGTGITTPNPDSDSTITAGGYANGQNDQGGVLVDGRNGLAKITFT